MICIQRVLVVIFINKECYERRQEFLKECGVYYLATIDGDIPRVRPFGTAEIFDGHLYI